MKFGQHHEESQIKCVSIVSGKHLKIIIMTDFTQKNTHTHTHTHKGEIQPYEINTCIMEIYFAA